MLTYSCIPDISQAPYGDLMYEMALTQQHVFQWRWIVDYTDNFRKRKTIDWTTETYRQEAHGPRGSDVGTYFHFLPVNFFASSRRLLEG